MSIEPCFFVISQLDFDIVFIKHYLNIFTEGSGFKSLTSFHILKSVPFWNFQKCFKLIKWIEIKVTWFRLSHQKYCLWRLYEVDVLALCSKSKNVEQRNNISPFYCDEHSEEVFSIWFALEMALLFSRVHKLPRVSTDNKICFWKYFYEDTSSKLDFIIKFRKKQK